MWGVRRTALVSVVAALVGGAVAPPARAADAVTAQVLMPTSLPPGGSTTLVLDPSLGLVSSVVDPSGDFSFSKPTYLFHQYSYLSASLDAVPASTAPHDLDLTLADSSHVTCTGCLRVAQSLSAPTGTVTPGDGTLSFSLTPPTVPAGETLLGYRVGLSDGTWFDTSSSTPVVSGLSNGQYYGVIIAARTDQRVGERLDLSGTPGRAPATPAVTLAPGLHKVTADATTTSDNYPVTYHWTVKVGSLTSYTADDTGPLEISTYGARDTVTVTARATTQLGSSATSAPVSATSLTYPSAPRLVRTSFADGRLTVAWNPPLDNGGRPVTGYDLVLTTGGTTTHRRLTGTTYTQAAVAGSTVISRVRAITQIAIGDEGRTDSSADLGEAVALDSTGHVRRRFLENGYWYGMGSPVMVGTPSIARAHSGVRLVVAGDKDGRVWGHTSTSGWRVMTSTRCWRPAASFAKSFNYLYVGCVSSDGHLLAMSLVLKGSSVPTGIHLAKFTWKPLGRLASVRGSFVFRTAPFDSAGHNVVAAEPFGAGLTRLPLTCASDPGAGTGGTGNYDNGEGWASCLATSTKLVWVRASLENFRGTRSTGAAILPFAAVGQPSLFVSRVGIRGLIAIVGKDGVVRELDTAFRTWRTAGGLTVKPGLSVVQYRG